MDRDEFFRRKQQARAVPTPPTRPPKIVVPTPAPIATPVKKPNVAKRRRRLGRRAVAAIVLLAIIIIASAAAYAWHMSRASSAQDGIPKAVRQQAGFTVLAPPTGVVTDTVKYNSGQKSLSYQVSSPVALTVSEQPTPSQFADITGYSDKFYAGLNQYQTFQTGQGTVSLTHPSGQNGADVAVINYQGTLTFISSTAGLSLSQWESVVTSLQAIKN